MGQFSQAIADERDFRSIEITAHPARIVVVRLEEDPEPGLFCNAAIVFLLRSAKSSEDDAFLSGRNVNLGISSPVRTFKDGSPRG